MDEGLLSENDEGWLYDFPLYRHKTSFLDTFRTLINLEREQRRVAGLGELADDDEMRSSQTIHRVRSHFKVHTQVSSTDHTKGDGVEHEIDVDQLCKSMARRLGFIDAAGDTTGRARFTETVTGMSERMEIAQFNALFEAMDVNNNGKLSWQEIEEVLTNQSKTLQADHGRVLSLVVGSFRKMLPRRALVLRLQAALYSLYLFNKRQMFTRRMKMCGVSWGKHFQYLLTGTPVHSIFAQLATLNVLRATDRLDFDSPVEFTAIWMAKKASDTEKMLLGGFLDVLSRLSRSPAGLSRPPVTDLVRPPSWVKRDGGSAAADRQASQQFVDPHALADDDQGLEMQDFQRKDWPSAAGQPSRAKDSRAATRGKAPLLDMAGSHSADEDVGSIASSNPSEDLEATPSFSGW